jgi:hypothetical protein
MEHWVPKVHPLARAAAADDPLELVATPVAGDPAVMLECLVQEFACMGWDAAEVMGLFRSPMYPVLNQLREFYGDDEVGRRVAALLARRGVFRVREVVAADPEPEDDEPELIQLNVRRVAGI